MSTAQRAGEGAEAATPVSAGAAGAAAAAATAAPPGWRPRLRRALGHTLKARLVLVFLALALGTTAVFFAGSRVWFSSGWRDVARPLLSDYVDRLAAEIGSPPDLARARALVQRLPVAIRIDGPQLQWDSHPERREHGPHDANWRALLERRTADGHLIRFSLGDWPGDDRPRGFGWLTLAALLALTGGAYAYARRLLRPVEDIHAGALRYGAGDFSQAIPLRRHDELGELATQVNTMAASLQHMLEGQRGLLLAISHELRSPLTRARLHAELLADGPERLALLRDLGQMRDRSATCWRASAWPPALRCCSESLPI
jgi:signal transduction histidine kinase